MKPEAVDRIERIYDQISLAKRVGKSSADIIASLVARHGATYTCRPCTNTLRVAGVTATCTWSKDEGLLSAWKKNATVRIARERMK
jgi:hypothetical protein